MRPVPFSLTGLRIHPNQLPEKFVTLKNMLKVAGNQAFAKARYKTLEIPNNRE
jgi:hypothetical protein